MIIQQEDRRKRGGESYTPSRIGEKYGWRHSKELPCAQNISFILVKELRKGQWKNNDGISITDIRTNKLFSKFDLQFNDIRRIARGEGCKFGRIRL